MHDRVVIITGAARGLGRAMALALAERGGRIAAIDLPSAGAAMDALLDEARRLGLSQRILPIHGDVRLPAQCAQAVDATLARFGAVHGLVNNAARRLGNDETADGELEVQKKFFEVDAETWQAVVATNINGPFLMAKAAVPQMLAQGFGRVVNIVTSYPTMIGGLFAPYGPSKAAMEAATVIWAKDLEGTGVTVNALLPGGPANTRMIPRALVPDRSTLIQPQAMQAPIAWLLSEASGDYSGWRFIAQDWDPKLAAEENIRRAGAKAGWQS